MKTAAAASLLLACGSLLAAPAEDAQRHVRRVMNSGLNFAERVLAARGEFAPFGAVMLPDGLIQHVAADSPDDDAPADVLLEQLIHALSAGAASGAYRVVATFALVELRDPQGGRTVTAVRVGLEHRDGSCADVFFSTELRDGALRLGEGFAREREGVFFVCDRAIAVPR